MVLVEKKDQKALKPQVEMAVEMVGMTNKLELKLEIELD
jgi:hypothetical protein